MVMKMVIRLIVPYSSGVMRRARTRATTNWMPWEPPCSSTFQKSPCTTFDFSEFSVIKYRMLPIPRSTVRDGQPFLCLYAFLFFNLLRSPALQTAESMIQLREAMLEVDEEAVMTAQLL